MQRAVDPASGWCGRETVTVLILAVQTAIRNAIRNRNYSSIEDYEDFIRMEQNDLLIAEDDARVVELLIAAGAAVNVTDDVRG
jgi:hypothetical protein